jgi:uncharacterized membrane protein
MQQFAMIIPDGANRIMKMAEDQATHRIDLEKKVVSTQLKESSRGQLFGLIIAALGLLVSAFLGYHGKEVAASVVGGATLVGLVTVFIKGQGDQS